jgi:23S rRNA pseudouridine2605 synthase
MSDRISQAPNPNPGVDANRKSLAGSQPLTVTFKPIVLADVVSGEYDKEEGRDVLNDEMGKRVLPPQLDSPKLHKVLAQAGMGSRLEMEKLIAEGRIAVNNEMAHVGQRVQYGDQIKVDGKPIRIRIDPSPSRVIAYHKPAGEIVSHDDPQNRPSVFRKLPRLHNGKWQAVGRLDLNTEGLLLFTSLGELANKLMHPRFGLEREYAVRVLGALSKEEKQKLLDGVMLEDGLAQFGSIEDGGGEGSNCWYRVTISEGRNREVRRMMDAVGHAVSRLIRIRYGSMVLPHGLRRGAWLELDEADIRSLMRAAGTRERSQPFNDQSARNHRNDRRPRTGGQGRAGSAVPRAKPVARTQQMQGGVDLHAKSDAPKAQAKYIGADSFNRLKKAKGEAGRGGRGSSGRSR